MQQKIEIILETEPDAPEGKLAFKVQTVNTLTTLRMLNGVMGEVLNMEQARQTAPIAPRRPDRVGGILLPNGPLPTGG